jgi:hypothetical protein
VSFAQGKYRRRSPQNEQRLSDLSLGASLPDNLPATNFNDKGMQEVLNNMLTYANTAPVNLGGLDAGNITDALDLRAGEGGAGNGGGNQAKKEDGNEGTHGFNSDDEP